MITREEFEGLINSIKEKLDETSSALVSEDLLAVVSNYLGALDKITELGDKVEKLDGEKEELLKVNGRLFQKIGFEEEKEDAIEEAEEVAEEIAIEDIIDEKGEFKDE